MGLLHRYDGWDSLLLVCAAVAVLHVPFTKVEESFNLQATHDLLYHTQLSSFDHLEFPGVVPRTFWGPLILAFCSAPAVTIVRLLGGSKLAALYVVRLTLASGTVASIANYRAALKETLGPRVAAAFAAIYLVQFHPLFYAGRPLPNVFATMLTTWAMAAWVRQGSPGKVLALLVAATVVFRCDTVLLLLPVSLLMLHRRQLAPTLLAGVAQMVRVGVVVGALALAATVLLDSWMWRRPLLWPEGEVLWFNTALNKSGDYGTMPAHWYLTSALPKALLAPALFVPLGAYFDRRVRDLLAAAAGFVALYSLLPHKELRFVFPVLPLLNTAAAAALARLHTNRNKAPLWRMAYAASVAALLASAAASTVFTQASRCNYPGGAALVELHRLHAAAAGGSSTSAAPSVHVDVLAAMTGVSRFGEHAPATNWTYSKQEGLSAKQLAAQGFDYLVSGAAAVAGYDAMHAEHGFERLQVVRAPVPHVRLKQSPQVYIHRRKKTLSLSDKLFGGRG